MQNAQSLALKSEFPNARNLHGAVSQTSLQERRNQILSRTGRAEFWPGVLPMKRRDLVRAALGVVLFGVGLLVALPTPYRERTVVFKTNGCRLNTSIIEGKSGPVRGSVVLLHGLAANKKIMTYVARGYAALGLRVIVPDLPGHGRTPGPFSTRRAEECSAALVQDLFIRGMA